MLRFHVDGDSLNHTLGVDRDVFVTRGLKSLVSKTPLCVWTGPKSGWCRIWRQCKALGHKLYLQSWATEIQLDLI